MSENCSKDCANCQENCADRDPQSFLAKPHEQSSIKRIIGIVSGKGGVGKSLVTSLLAVTTAKLGKKVGVLDADITGPSMGKVFGITDKAVGDESGIYPATTKNNIDVMTVNMMLETDETPIIWRGPMVADIVKQFYSNVIWKDLDVLYVDMPPGTGDVPLTVFQSLPLDGIVIVTSPQELVSMVVAKAINMANMMNIPVLGMVENMSYLECPNCHEKMEIFGPSHSQEVADHFHLPLLAKLPLNPSIAALSDEGRIEEATCAELEPVVQQILG